VGGAWGGVGGGGGGGTLNVVGIADQRNKVGMIALVGPDTSYLLYFV